MSPIPPLSPDRLYRACDTDRFTFTTTADLDDLADGLGQVRAVDAANFGIGMRHAGYILHVMGQPGSGKRYLVRQLLDRRVGEAEKPADWCYVHNFGQPHKPRAIRLPAGMGTRLHADMQQLVAELQATIPAVFEGEEYRRRFNQIDEEYSEHQTQAFGSVAEEANRHNIMLLRTPNGFSFAPAKGDEVMSPDDFDKLSAEDKTRIEQDIASLQEKLEKVIRQVHHWRRERIERVRKLNEEVVLFAVGHLIDDLRRDYAEFPAVCSYLNEVQQNVIERMDEFRKPREVPAGLAALAGELPTLNRFRVNLLVARDADEGAPVVHDDHPTYAKLSGRVEQTAQLGALVTSF